MLTPLINKSINGNEASLPLFCFIFWINYWQLKYA